MSFNKVILMGNLTRDPEVRELPGGGSVTTLGLAVNEKWTTKDGEKREDVCFVDVDAFGRQGEVVMEYFGKGKPILIEGKLRFRSWEDGDGNKRSKHSLVLDRFSFVGSRDSSNGQLPDSTDNDVPF